MTDQTNYVKQIKTKLKQTYCYRVVELCKIFIAPQVILT